MRQKYTPEGLPVVTKETILSLRDIIKREIKKDRCEFLVRSFLYRLKEENLLVLKLVGDFVIESLKDEDLKNEYFSGAFITYESLRRQYASNKLEKEIASIKPLESEKETLNE